LKSSGLETSTTIIPLSPMDVDEVDLRLAPASADVGPMVSALGMHQPVCEE